MGFRYSFRFGVLWRLGLLLCLAALALHLFTSPDKYAAITVLVGLCILSFINLLGFISRGNRDTIRFVEAMQTSDFSQSFSSQYRDSGFSDLANALQSAMNAQRSADILSRQKLQVLDSMVDDVPVALLQTSEGRIEPINKAARKLFNTVSGIGPTEFSELGKAFVSDVITITASGHQLSTITNNGSSQSVMLTASHIQAGTLEKKIVSVQPIQSELDMMEMSTWRDLVRVLTHEIMNSMTPVTSLAKTAAMLMGGIDDGKDQRITDVRQAVDIVAKRSDGLMHFVQSYRALTVAPTIKRQTIRLSVFLAELAGLFEAEWPTDHVRLHIDCTKKGESFFADPDLIGQLLINLLRNAAQACIGYAIHPSVTLRCQCDTTGSTIFDIVDNGPGVQVDRHKEIFLPFFTTKDNGTGIGLSLSRQIALAHGGTLTLLDQSGPGATFRLKLPAD